MDEQTKEIPQVPRQRRKKTKLQIFKEAYLPLVIILLTIVMVIIFIVGSITRASQRRKEELAASIQASQEAANEARILSEEAQRLLEEAEFLAAGYDMEGAIAVIDSFSGNLEDFPELAEKRMEYFQVQSTLVEYSDYTEIPNLSFQLLIADPARAFHDDLYGSSYRNNFITTTEFSNILNQLYENDYILVNLRDLISVSMAEDGFTVYAPKSIFLPNGKKPIILTQTNVNYYTYMTDSDGDGLPDAGGDGFGSRLVLDNNSRLAVEMVNSDGSTATGAYDLIPILEEFLRIHPDFSYRGAKAIIGVTGYDGLFGYRTNESAREKLGESAYEQELSSARNIADALRANGYEIACYSYENLTYAESDSSAILADLQKWDQEVTPILGQLDTVIFPRGGDISDSDPYTGMRYETLTEAGFRIFLGSSDSEIPWTSITEDYVRQHRINVSGSGLNDSPELYAEYFDAVTVRDPARPSES